MIYDTIVTQWQHRTIGFSHIDH